MWLELIPKEDGLYKRVYDIYENERKFRMEISLSRDLISDTDHYEDWFQMFREHYCKTKEQQVNFSKERGIQSITMSIPIEKPKIKFEVDYSHMCFRFYYPEKDEESRDIIYKFIERILN